MADTLAKDVAKIAKHRIPVDRDSSNIAIVKKPSESAVSQYEIRYFGFDYSSKTKPISISKLHEKSLGAPNIKQATELFRDILTDILRCEFGYDPEEDKPPSRLQNRLVEKYSQEIVSLLEKV